MILSSKKKGKRKEKNGSAKSSVSERWIGEKHQGKSRVHDSSGRETETPSKKIDLKK